MNRSQTEWDADVELISNMSGPVATIVTVYKVTTVWADSKCTTTREVVSSTKQGLALT